MGNFKRELTYSFYWWGLLTLAAKCCCCSHVLGWTPWSCPWDTERTPCTVPLLPERRALRCSNASRPGPGACIIPIPWHSPVTPGNLTGLRVSQMQVPKAHIGINQVKRGWYHPKLLTECHRCAINLYEHPLNPYAITYRQELGLKIY